MSGAVRLPEANYTLDGINMPAIITSSAVFLILLLPFGKPSSLPDVGLLYTVGDVFGMKQLAVACR